MPLMASDFLFAITEFPIVFPDDNEIVLSVLLPGLRNSENIYVGCDGNLKGRTIPAFIRRYLFVLTLSDDGQQ